jgi:hypothetical protein
VGTIRDGDALYHFSQTTAVFPTEGYGDEGYVILRDGVQVRSVFWVWDTENKTAEPPYGLSPLKKNNADDHLPQS